MLETGQLLDEHLALEVIHLVLDAHREQSLRVENERFAGGIERAPERGAAIGATAIQVFTKSPNQWRERRIGARQVARFRAALGEHGIRAVVAHDAYLINLASPDRRLRARSLRAFRAELQRCRDLGIPYLVTHPGNFMDQRGEGLKRNAAAYEECLSRVPGPAILIETGSARLFWLEDDKNGVLQRNQFLTRTSVLQDLQLTTAPGKAGTLWVTSDDGSDFQRLGTIDTATGAKTIAKWTMRIDASNTW